MNPTRFEIVLKSQSAVARKVFAGVPTDESWSSAKIYAELQRRGGSTRNLRIVEGCLNTLMRVGLVVEGPRGHFMQYTPRVIDKPVDVVPVTVAPDSAPVESPVVEVASTVESSDNVADDMPFHLEPNTTVYEPNPDYEAYLNYRVERIESMLIMLSEKLDSETGLAVLEIAEDLGDYHHKLLDYRGDLENPCAEKMVLNPGWYHHEVNGRDVFSRNAVLTENEIAVEMEKQQKYALELEAFHREFPYGSFQFQREEREYREQLFAQFEPNGEGERPYYDSLMDRLKSYVPDIESVADTGDTTPNTVGLVKERKNRRGMCDVKIKGISQAPEYRAWMNIVAPGNVQALLDEGLEVEESWLNSFKAFLSDIGYRPEYGARLFRIYPELGWVRDNVEWRKEGRTIPARRRAPTNWPMMQATDNVERGLKEIVRQARNKAKELIS